MNKKKIITIVNKVAVTSMPINEFTLYRNKHLDEEAIVFSLEKVPSDIKKIYSSFEVHSFPTSPIQYIKKLWSYSDHIFHMHNARSAFLNTLLTLFFPKRIFRIMTVHNNFNTFNLINKLMIIFVCLFAKKVSFVSKASYDSFPKILKKIWKNKLFIITNGVDLGRVDDFLKDIEIKQKDTSSVNIINIGRLNEQKNQDVLLHVFSKLPSNYFLTIIGQGDKKIHLLSLAKELKVDDRLNMTGLIPREEVYSNLINSDIFINTALWEGMPIAVLEAMACKIPVLLSNIPPHKEIDNLSSMELISDSIDQYIDKIIQFSRLDKINLDSIKDENRKIVEENYSLKYMHQQYNNLYEISN